MQVWFQSSFELTGYITITNEGISVEIPKVSKLFRAYGLYNSTRLKKRFDLFVSKLFRAYGLYNCLKLKLSGTITRSFKALSSLRVI